MTTVFQVSKTISYQTYYMLVYSNHKNVEKYNIPQSTVFEDNDACLQFARMPRLTPRTKHIGILYKWNQIKLLLYELIQRINWQINSQKDYKLLLSHGQKKTSRMITHTLKGRVELAVEINLMKCYQREVSCWLE
jgi:hypothetical protein